jgi:formylglycine-generating enzyme required for sulfatase activity
MPDTIKSKPKLVGSGAPPPHPDMVWIPGGTFDMGSNDHYPEERPVHRVGVDGFWIDRYPVTNERFRCFVEATGHVTFAETPPTPADYPGALPDMLYAGSLVFVKAPGPVDLRNFGNWWTFMRGADWRHPAGPQSSIGGRKRHPVVHVAFGDAEAFARWEGKELPTEAESYDPCQPAIRIPRKVLKGGSHLCAPNYCRRYRPAARFPEPADTSTCHVGFRCVVRVRGQCRVEIPP